MTEAAQSLILWYAGRYDPVQAIVALSFVVTLLLFIGTAPLWADKL